MLVQDEYAVGPSTVQVPLAPTMKNRGVHVKAAVCIFILMLLAFVTESQLTQLVEANMHFRKPMLLLYVAHSSMTVVFPLHVFYLHLTTPFSANSYLRGLSQAVAWHYFRKQLQSGFSPSAFPTAKFVTTVVLCTLGVTLPSALWFAAVSLSSISDITAIWNSNAFWTYVICILLGRHSLDYRKFAAVTLASVGVLVVVYGSKDDHLNAGAVAFNLPRAPFFGNVLTFIASVSYAYYQVAYNLYAVPASESELDPATQKRFLSSSEIFDTTGVEEEDMVADSPEDSTSHESIVYPPPFGLYANALTSAIGLVTLLVLWIPLVLLNIMDIEPFAWPTNLSLLFSVVGICICSLTFFMTLMILLGVWGPVVTSVGNLLTIVLVAISDLIFGDASKTMRLSSILGSSMIIIAFSVVVFESLRR